MAKDYTQENEQFYDAIDRYGRDRILRQFTELTNAIDHLGDQSTIRFDMCPDRSCSGHQQSKGVKKGNFELFTDGSYGGYCYKCAQLAKGTSSAKKAFSFFDIIMEFKGWNFADTCKEIRALINFKPDPNYVPTPSKVKKHKATVKRLPTAADKAKAQKRRTQMNTYWSEAFFLDDEWSLPAAKYFAKRGITKLHSLMRNQVKFHPAMPFYIPLPTSKSDKTEEDKQLRLNEIAYCKNHPSFAGFIMNGDEPTMANMGTHPCLLLLIRNKEGHARRLHRIFIDSEGNKASFHKAGYEIKKMMPGGYGMEIDGCSCYLDGPSPVRGAGEGLETVLAVKDVTGMPMDCTITAGGLAGYQPPAGTEVVYLWEDKDRSKTGQLVCKQAKERLEKEGYTVHIMRVPIELNGEKTIDWLDVRNELGSEGFPEIAINWRQFLNS